MHDPAKPPDFMKKDAGRGTENFRPEDTEWVGETGELSDAEIDKFVADAFSAQTALKPLLLRIIRSNPNVFKISDERRLDSAIRPLIDPKWNPDSPAKPGRRRNATSEEIVAEMARGYFANSFDKGKKARSLSELARVAAGRLDPKFNGLSREEQKHQVYNLRRIFGEQKDKLLVRASNMLTARGRHQKAIVEKALTALETLGVVRPDDGASKGNTNP